MKKLYLAQKDRMISGVCGGIGETYNIDPTVVRIVTVFLCLVTGILPLLVTYIVARFIIPKEPTK